MGSLYLSFYPCQKYDFVELFAGQAWVSRCMKAKGYSVAALDIVFGDPKPGKQDAMDLLSDAGFAFLAYKLTSFHRAWKSREVNSKLFIPLVSL